MALSNIFREPRRELTESAVGLAAVGVFAVCDYGFGCWHARVTGNVAPGDWVLGTLLGVPVAAILAALLYATHAIGEAICNRLENAGLHLRPRTRR